MKKRNLTQDQLMEFLKLQAFILLRIIEKHTKFMHVQVFYLIMSHLEEMKILFQEKLQKIYHYY